jgi:CelD/BcsL family acetyltransferase involved in cellulose biosynthesis
LAAERFPDPVLLRAREGGLTVALGLFNRRRRFGHSNLLLNESGMTRYDDIFVEHNGLLVECGHPDTLVADCLRLALTARFGRNWRQRAHRLTLSGVPPAYLAALESGAFRAAIRAARPSPFVDLAALRRDGREYLDGVSANTRYQLRRSRRRYAASGALAVRSAGSVREALEFLDRLAELHQKYWTARGEPGAFAASGFRRFHNGLIERAFASGGVDLLRVDCGGRAIGYLYNFRYNAAVCAYQSGFDYAAAGPHQKPGLTCHHLAIEKYLSEGADRYDFLAGGDRYKISLATGATTLYWLQLARRRPVAAAAERLGAKLGVGIRRA